MRSRSPAPFELDIELPEQAEPAALGQIGERVAVEIGVEIFEGAGQDAGQGATTRDAALVVAAQAFDDGYIALGAADDGADVDAVGRARQAYAAALAAHGLDDAGFREMMDDLHQMVF